MASTSTPLGPASAERRTPSWRTLVRFGVPAGYLLGGAFIAATGTISLSTDELILWLVGFLIACSVTAPRRALQVLLDWVPIAAILLIYNLLRGYADGLLFRAHVFPQIRFDEFFFGQAPTLWLQQHLWHGPFDLRWWDFFTLGVYITHFLATLVLATVLWLVDYQRFRRYAVMICTLALAGFATYALYPAVPPWMAAENGDLPGSVTRIVPYAWSHVHVFSFDTLFQTGSQYANDVAAMPSLHAAFSLLVTLVLWQPARRWWVRAVLVAYPLAMGFALVYGGEHYVADVVAGWVYAVVVFASVEALFRALARRRQRRAPAAPAPPAAPARSITR